MNIRNLVTDHFWLVLLLSFAGILFLVLFPLFAVFLVVIVVALGLISYDSKKR